MTAPPSRISLPYRSHAWATSLVFVDSVPEHNRLDIPRRRSMNLAAMACVRQAPPGPPGRAPTALATAPREYPGRANARTWDHQLPAQVGSQAGTQSRQAARAGQINISINRRPGQLNPRNFARPLTS
jgi:hypothetical protein